MRTRRLLAVLAHPDDESLGFGGVLAKYAAEGAEVFLVTATRGEAGRYRGWPPGDPAHPGPDALGVIRETELRAAARALGIKDVAVLDYRDQELDRADPKAAIGVIAAHIRRLQPDIVVTFGPEGAYGHPDHIAVAQFTTAAIVAAASHADADVLDTAPYPPHAVRKLYYLAWPDDAWTAYQAAFKTLTARVDEVVRQATPWPDWAITTRIDTRAQWATVWSAVQCHDSQIAVYDRLSALPPNLHEALWGRQSFYRAFSVVNGGRRQETDLFDGVP